MQAIVQIKDFPIWSASKIRVQRRAWYQTDSETRAIELCDPKDILMWVKTLTENIGKQKHILCSILAWFEQLGCLPARVHVAKWGFSKVIILWLILGGNSAISSFFHANNQK